MENTMNRKGNLEIITFRIDKDEHRWYRFWITYSSRLCRGILDIKVLCRMFFLYSTWVAFSFKVELVVAIHTVLYVVTFG